MQMDSLKQIAQSLRHGDFSSEELTAYCLRKIQDSNLNSFIGIDEEQALQDARQIDRTIRKQELPLLAGIPMAAKDIFCTRNMNTSCGSKILAQFKAPYDATVISKLKNQGALLIGKTNMDEFAMGSTNETSFFGAVQNPWNQQHVSGGSSGGSAAAVAANLVPYTIGSDTGGSIRQPASFCGISGIKPTYGSISRYGMVAYASSLDQAGPMAHSAEDLALVLQAMIGFDDKDSTSIAHQAPDYLDMLYKPLNTFKIGLPNSFFQADVDPEVQELVHAAVKIFESLGAQIIPLELDYQHLWVPCYYVIACAEASSNLSRFDGLRYGYRSAHADNLQQLIRSSRSEGFGLEVKRRIITGTHLLCSGYYDAYYVQAQKIRRLIQQELLHTFNTVDCILGPTSPILAPKLGEKSSNPVQTYLGDVFTVAANLAGIPALSIPCGFAKGLPTGLQLMGKPFDEAYLLQLAHHYQQHTDWHRAKPVQ